ncbi:MAG TPA: methyltransferase domain-containing protein [Anaerolineales bacterium]|nr:methyltransferase domain-containing protein [Anaerolineales bacterium]
MIVLLLYGLSFLLLVLILLWVLVPALYGLPLVTTKPERIRKALRLANLQPDELLYDLGAGDGRVLLLAAREFGARAVGIEVGPLQCALIWLRAVGSGLGDRIQVKWTSFYQADLSSADVVFFYATSKEVSKISSHLERQLKPGSRLVSISADFPEWEPSTLDERELIFVYEMPPRQGNITSYWLRKAARDQEINSATPPQGPSPEN